MSGIFDRMNHPGTGFGEKTIAPANLCDALWLSVSGIRTNQQILSLLNDNLSPSPALDSESIQDLQDMVSYINGGSGVEGKVSRLNRICIVAGGWETGVSGITEAEARQATGVTYTF